MLYKTYNNENKHLRGFKMIRKGSTVSYKTIKNGKKYCGLGKVIYISPDKNTCEVMDCWEIFTCYLMDCENVCNW